MIKIQNDIFSDATEALKTYDIISIYGPHGCGKTYVSYKIQNFFKAEYKNSLCFYLEGDEMFQNRDYFCFKSCLSNMLEDYHRKQTKIEYTSHAIKEIPKIGEFFDYLYLNAMSYEDRKQEQLNYVLDNDIELDIVLKLRYLLQQKKGLIIIDNFQYLDQKSLELLNLLINNRGKLFSFLENTTFIFLITDCELYDNEKKLTEILKNMPHKNLYFRHMEYCDFNETLEKLGLQKELEERIKKLIYMLTDGHLEVIKTVIEKINTTTWNILVDKIKSKEELFDMLIKEKLEHLGEEGIKINEILKYASLIGLSFSKYDIEILTEYNHYDLLNLIERSDEIHLTTSDEKNAYFSHEFVKTLFEAKTSKQKYYYYSRMALCTKALYPHEYYQRMEYELNAGNTANAQIMAVLAVLQDYRNKTNNSRHTAAYVLIESHDQMYKYICSMRDAYSKFHIQDYLSAINLLEQIEPLLAVELLAEKDLLLSLSLTKTVDFSKRNKAAEILKSYQSLDSVNNEFDLWVRIMMSYMTASVHLGMRNNARCIEDLLYSELTLRLKYDNSVIQYVNVLRRRSNAIHDCNIAREYMRKGVGFFEFETRCEIYPIDFFLCVNNYIGVLCQCGDFSEAAHYSMMLQNFVMNHGDIKFPRIEAFVNNYLLSLLFAKLVPLDKCIEKYITMLKKIPKSNADRIFYFSNLSAFYMKAGKYDDAYKLLFEMYKRINFEKDNETMYTLSIYINFSIASALIGKIEQAKRVLNECLLHLDNANYKIYIKKKIELLINAFDKSFDLRNEKDPDEYLFKELSDYQDESWLYFGKMFYYSVLFYWSEL